MKKLLFFLVIVLFAASSCRKDKDDEVETDFSVLTEDDIAEISQGATELNALVNNTMMSYYMVALDSGYQISFPEMSQQKSTNGLKTTNPNDGGWSGPDVNGWYTRHWEGIYEYTERVRCNDTIVEYEFITSYDGADGSYESINKTQYHKYTENGKTLFKGYWDWSVSNSGYSDISSIHWRMTFDDWNPLTGAGFFDWWWGAQDGSSFEPFSRYFSISATEADDGWLDIEVSLYDGNTEVWSFEYTAPWQPVEMPELHTCGI